MRIQHNIPALNTFRQLGINNSGSAKALEKLSSGYKINRAGDDAAGLAISEKMRAQIRGLNRASSNAQDGISLIQAAEGALQESQNILQRMRELSVQAGNDTNSAEDRQSIQDEITQLTRELDRIANVTEFNKKTVLDGSLSEGKYGKLVSGSNVSSVSLITPTDPASTPLINGMSAVAVVQAGEHYDVSFNFSLADDGENVINGTVQDGGMGTFTVTLGADMMMAAGLDANTFQPISVAVVAGDTASTIAGNVMDLLGKALGDSFELSVAGAKVNVKHKYVGEFSGANGDGILIDISNLPNTIFEKTLDGSGGIEPGGAGIEGSEGRDLIIEVDGQAADLTNTVGLTAWQSASSLFSNSNVSGDATDVTSGTLRGKDAQLQLYLGDGTMANGLVSDALSFKIDDATKLSTAVLSVKDGQSLTLQTGANAGYSQTIGISVTSVSAKSLGVSEINVGTHKEAQLATIAIDGGLQIIADQRAALGAVQNRLEHTIANLDTVSENLQDAESRIRDVDIAKEMMNFTKYNILMQASQAMMAQANSLPQGVLQLLR